MIIEYILQSKMFFYLIEFRLIPDQTNFITCILPSFVTLSFMKSHLRTAIVVSHILDNQFGLFGLRFGLNSFLDLIPGMGDVVAALLSLYIVWIGWEMGLPRLKIIQMVGNILINFLIGLIPIVGDVVYIFRKANVKNVKILQDYAMKHAILKIDESAVLV